MSVSPDTGRLEPVDEFTGSIETIPELSLDQGRVFPRIGIKDEKLYFERAHHGWPVVYREEETGNYYWKKRDNRTMYVLNCPTRGADVMPDLATHFMKGSEIGLKDVYTWVYELNFTDGNHVLTDLLAAPTKRPEGFVKIRPVKILEENEEEKE